MHSEKVDAFRANRLENVGAFRANETQRGVGGGGALPRHIPVLTLIWEYPLRE